MNPAIYFFAIALSILLSCCAATRAVTINSKNSALNWESIYLDLLKAENGWVENKEFPSYTAAASAVKEDQAEFWKSYSKAISEAGRSDSIALLKNVAETNGASIVILAPEGRNVLSDEEILSIIKTTEKSKLWRIRYSEQFHDSAVVRRVRNEQANQ